MKGQTFFSEEPFINAVVNSFPSTYEKCLFKFNEGYTQSSIFGVKQRCSFSRRSLALGPFGLYASLGLTANRSLDAVHSIVRQLKGVRSHSVVWNVRFDHQDLAENLRRLRLTEQSSETQVLTLPCDYDNLNATYNATIRNQIRRAKREGVIVRQVTNLESIRSYHKIHQVLAAQKGTYKQLYPLELFNRLAALTGYVWILVAEFKDQIIAGGVFFRDGDSMFYWHGASDRQYSKLFPSCAVIDTAIHIAIANKMSTFNMGASGGIASLEQFKSFWGAEKRSCWQFTWKNPMWESLKRLKAN